MALFARGTLNKSPSTLADLIRASPGEATATAMRIQRITIRDFGNLYDYERAFNPSVNVIDSRYTEEILAAVELLLCSKIRRRVPEGWVRGGTQIHGEILGNDCRYFASISPGDGACSELELRVVDQANKDVTADYRRAMSHCREQDAVESFDGRNRSLPVRLCRYRTREEYPNFAEETEDWGRTRTFRAHLAKYIRDFRPQTINNKKPYQLTINPKGEFEVFLPGGSGRIHLSETEEKLFLYGCFLNIAEFWRELEHIRDFHHEKKPLLIRNFLECLDCSTDMEGLLQRTIQLQRQILFLTIPLGEENMRWYPQ